MKRYEDLSEEEKVDELATIDCPVCENVFFFMAKTTFIIVMGLNQDVLDVLNVKPIL